MQRPRAGLCALLELRIECLIEAGRADQARDLYRRVQAAGAQGEHEATRGPSAGGGDDSVTPLLLLAAHAASLTELAENYEWKRIQPLLAPRSR